MMIRKALKTAVAAAALTLGGAFAHAQYGPGPYPGQYAYQGGYDDQHWGRGPAGYVQIYPEQPGQPRLGARQGWVAGLAQGQSDRAYGHSYRPTHVDTFKHVPRCPQDYTRDLFKQEYRDAFVHGYQRGYGA